MHAGNANYCDPQGLLSLRSSIADTFWINVWTIATKRVENIKAHPSLYLKPDDVWVNA